jgi:hypothetical protein
VLFGSGLKSSGLGQVRELSVWLLLAGGLGGLVISSYILERHNTSVSQASWLARWAGIAATMDVSAYLAIRLFRFGHSIHSEQQALPIRSSLTGVSYLILAAVFLIIIGGLGWCFMRALIAAGASEATDSPHEADGE